MKVKRRAKYELECLLYYTRTYSFSPIQNLKSPVKKQTLNAGISGLIPKKNKAKQNKQTNKTIQENKTKRNKQTKQKKTNV